MRTENNLISILNNLLEILSAESSNKPDLAKRIEKILNNYLSQKSNENNIPPENKMAENLPDLYSEWDRRGEEDFRQWLGSKSRDTLKSLIKEHDFDPHYKARRWEDVTKIANFIADQLKARRSKGASFM